MDATSITHFVDSARNVFHTMLNLPVQCGKPVKIPEIPVREARVSGFIGLSGDVAGTVVLSLPVDVAQGVVSKFVGSPVSTDSEDFTDAVGELVNMVTGGAKSRLEGSNIDISVPTVVMGSDYRVQQMTGTVCIEIPCNCSCGQFSIVVCIARTGRSAAPKTASTSAAAGG